VNSQRYGVTEALLSQPYSGIKKHRLKERRGNKTVRRERERERAQREERAAAAAQLSSTAVLALALYFEVACPSLLALPLLNAAP
jgi:hypothetical protein